MGPIDQFNIVPYFTIGPISFTNASLAMAMTCALTFYSMYVLPRTSKSFQILNELYYDFIRGLCASNMKHDYEFLIPFVSSLFLFIMFGNLIGLVPGFFTFTSHLTSNLIVSGTVVTLILVLAIIKHGTKFIRLFIPSGVPVFIVPLVFPIELISFVMRIFSLAIRLCINMCVGHITLKVLLILATKFGVVGPMVSLFYVPFFLLEVGIAMLQAYIFATLSCVYLGEGLHLGH